MQIEQTETRYGPMWIFSDDPGCSRMLKEYGEFSQLELDVASHYITPDSLVLDIGAHIGAMTLPLAAMCRKVIAFEPQKVVRELLERNVSMARLSNVEVMPYALALEPGTAYCSLSHSGWDQSYGSVSMEQANFEGAEEVKMVKLDDLNLQPDFIKLDVEGMESHVMAGGAKTIMTHHPIIMAERPTDPPMETAQIQLLTFLGYYIARLDFPFFVANNWKGVKRDIYPAKAHMMQIAIPGTKAAA